MFQQMNNYSNSQKVFKGSTIRLNSSEVEINRIRLTLQILEKIYDSLSSSIKEYIVLHFSNTTPAAADMPFLRNIMQS